MENFLGLRTSVGLAQDASLFELNLCGWNLVYLVGHAIVWLTLLLLIDMWPEIKGFLCCCCNRRSTGDQRQYVPVDGEFDDTSAVAGDDVENVEVVPGVARQNCEREDVDVYEERMRVLNGHDTDALSIINLSKIFKVYFLIIFVF